MVNTSAFTNYNSIARAMDVTDFVKQDYILTMQPKKNVRVDNNNKKKKCPVKFFKTKKYLKVFLPRARTVIIFFPPLNCVVLPTAEAWGQRTFLQKYRLEQIKRWKPLAKPLWYHCYWFGRQNGSGELLCLQVFVRVCA